MSTQDQIDELKNNSKSLAGKIEDKLDKIDNKLGDINATLIEQHVTLKEHIRRTANLEDRVTPLERRMWMAMGAIAFLTLLAALKGLM